MNIIVSISGLARHASIDAYMAGVLAPGETMWPVGGAGCAIRPKSCTHVETNADIAFGVTFDDTRNYYTVVIPPAVVRCTRTQWHARDEVCTRGAFENERAAHQWAEEHLEGHPYRVAFIDVCAEERDA